MKTYKTSNKKIIFILCSIRSGSTLLKNMLDQHSDIFAPAELHILPFDNLDDMELNYKNTSLTKGLIEAIIKLTGCDEYEAGRLYDDFKKSKFSSQDIYDWFLSNINETYLVDKSPTYTINADALAKCHTLNNDVMYIHLLRHPMAVIKSAINNNFDKLARLLNYNSARATRQLQNTSLSNFVYFESPKMNNTKHKGIITEGIWRECNKNISDFLEGVSQDRKTEVYYEDLVTNPENTMRDLCAFLGLDYEVKMTLSQGIFSNVDETIGDPNFFKRNNIINQNAFCLKELLDDEWQIDQETIELAIKYKYLCWESEKTLDLLPTEKQFFNQNDYHNNHCLITSFESNAIDRFDERKLTRSLAEMMIENPNLSSVFVQNDVEWKRKLVGDSQIQITRIFSNPNENIYEILDYYTDLWVKGMDISDGPLLTIFYVYQNKKLTVRYVVHHLLMDGSAMLNFHTQLWNGYSSHLTNSPMNASQSDIQDYIEVCNSATHNNENSRDQLDLHPVFTHRKETPTYDTQNEIRLVVSKTKDQQEKFNFNELACSLYSILGSYTDTNKVSIAHRFHNRRVFGENRKNLFAWLASDAPITLDLQQSNSALLRDFKSSKRRIDAEGLAFNLNTAGVELHNDCPVRFNYIPVILKQNLSAVNFDKYESTLSFDVRNEMDYMLDFIVRESKEQIEIIVRYSTTEFEQEFLQSFINQWVNQLHHYSVQENVALKHVA